MTGRAEIYRVVPWVILEMQGAGWASRPLALECSVMCVGVPTSTLRPDSVPLGGKAQQAPSAGAFGAPFRAQVLGGERGRRGRGLQGTQRGSPRAPPLERPQCVSVFGNVVPVAGWDPGTALELVSSERFHGFQAALRMGALEFCSSRTGDEV